MAKLPQTRIPVRQLLWHAMMGATLGLLFAGLLLLSRLPAMHLIVGHASSLARVEFLLGVALFFGIGATLTGALFLVSEESVRDRT